MILPAQQVTILDHVQITTMCTLGVGRRSNAQYLPILLAIFSMLFSTYYTQNYAGIIGTGLMYAQSYILHYV